MDILTILLIAVSTLLGAAISYWVLRQKNSDIRKAEAEIEQVFEKEEQNDHVSEVESSNIETLIADIKAKYEASLFEANTQIEKLKSQIKQSIEAESTDGKQCLSEEVEVLKKKIKKLNDEIEENQEEYEEEINAIKKKISSKDEEIGSLNDCVRTTKRDNEKLTQKLEQVESELEEKNSELVLKMGSLTFIQEILSAKQASDSSTKTLYENVDALVRFIQGALLDCVKNVEESYTLNHKEELFGYGLTHWSLVAKKSWIQGKTSVAFVGEFSAGKTSIVNRILSQDNPDAPLLPVSTKATTAIPTYISGGVSTRYNFVSPDNILKHLQEDTFRRINKEVLDQIKGISSLIQYFVMTYNNPILDKLSILDTPGFSSNDAEDAERTINVINECDALFWVFDVNTGTVNRKSIELIKMHLKKPLFVIINKVDTKAAIEVERVEQLISKTFKDNGVSVQKIIQFSSKSNINELMQTIRSVSHNLVQDSYIDNLLCSIKELADLIKTDVAELYNEYMLTKKKGEELDEQFEEKKELLCEHCEAVSEIPKWETYLFKKDRYEMSKDEGERMCELLLDDIGGKDMEGLRLISDNRVEVAQYTQQAYSDYRDLKDQWRNMDSRFEELSKIVKKIKLTNK